MKNFKKYMIFYILNIINIIIFISIIIVFWFNRNMIFISVDNNKHNIKTNLQNQKSGITELVKTDNHFNNPFSNKLSKNEIYKIKLKGIIYNKNNEPVAIIEVNNKILYKQKNEKVFYWTIKNILKNSIEISDNIKKQKLKMNKEIILKK